MSKEKKQYIYVLKLINRLLDENNWTKEDENIVGEHFNKLKENTLEGKVILAGRTLNTDEDSFGIVIFEAENDEEDNNFMNNEPAVKKGIMTAKVYPYKIALLRK